MYSYMKYTEFFKILSDQTRFTIFLLIAKGPLCVCELTALLEIEQSRVSHALKELKRVSLIEEHRLGKWIIYNINEDITFNKVVKTIIDTISLDEEIEKKLNTLLNNGERIWKKQQKDCQL